MKIENVEVYGIKESFKASKYSMAADTDKTNSDYTDRIKSLGKTKIGLGYDVFMTGIIVQFDLTFSNKAWIEAQRYHFLDFVTSQGTMHCIHKMKINEMCNKYVDQRVIDVCEELRDKYNKTKDEEDYLKLLYNIPAGFELTARMTTNYRQLKTIYAQRKNHRLPEWRKFCEWIETLPYSELITGVTYNQNEED